MRYQSNAIWVAGAALLLAGCAGVGDSDEKNYKVNDEPARTNFEPSSRSTSKPLFQLATVDEPPIGLTATDATGSVSESSPPKSATQPAADGKTHVSKMHGHALAPDTQPSVIGFDRSAWPKVVVGPESGSVGAYPTYFKDPLPEFDRHRAEQPVTESEQLTWPLRDERSESFVGRNKWTEFWIQPGNMFFDLIISPYSVYEEVPWKDEHTPDHAPFAQVVPNKRRSEAEINSILATPTTRPAEHTKTAPTSIQSAPTSKPSVETLPKTKPIKPTTTQAPAPIRPAVEPPKPVVVTPSPAVVLPPQPIAEVPKPVAAPITVPPIPSNTPATQPAVATTQPQNKPEEVDPNSIGATDLATDSNKPSTTAPAPRKPHVSPLMKWLSGE